MRILQGLGVSEETTETPLEDKSALESISTRIPVLDL